MATKLTARLSLSWTKQRQLRKISKSVGIKIDSEKKGIIVQKDLMCANVCVEQLECHVMMYFFEKATNTDCLKTHLWHPFRIDQPLFRIFRAVPRERKKLTWNSHTIPDDPWGMTKTDTACWYDSTVRRPLLRKSSWHCDRHPLCCWRPRRKKEKKHWNTKTFGCTVYRLGG